MQDSAARQSKYLDVEILFPRKDYSRTPHFLWEREVSCGTGEFDIFPLCSAVYRCTCINILNRSSKLWVDVLLGGQDLVFSAGCMRWKRGTTGHLLEGLSILMVQEILTF